MGFLEENLAQLILKTFEHLFLSMSALALGVLFAVPLGLLISRSEKISNLVIKISSILQTVPSLALLAIMIPIFGVGKVPAIAALFIYSLLPILRNAVSGVNSVNEDIVDAAKGMGLTRIQIIFKVQVPLSISFIMAGIRLSSIYVIAWTSLAAYVGAGGLGEFIFAGLNTYKLSMIVAGTIPITLMALLIDSLLGLLEKQMIPSFSREIASKGDVR